MKMSKSIISLLWPGLYAFVRPYVKSDKALYAAFSLGANRNGDLVVKAYGEKFILNTAAEIKANKYQSLFPVRVKALIAYLMLRRDFPYAFVEVPFFINQVKSKGK